MSIDTPLHVFAFEITFRRSSLTSSEPGQSAAICNGGFAECTGLEATMEPKVIKAGGANYGSAQRAGPVSFATVVLKRGLTQTRDLFTWFSLVSGGKYAYRLDAEIAVRNAAGATMMTWVLTRAMPVKFKAADLNAKGTEVGIEELHLVHEGLRLIPGDGAGSAGLGAGVGFSASATASVSVGVSVGAGASIGF